MPQKADAEWRRIAEGAKPRPRRRARGPCRPWASIMPPRRPLPRCRRSPKLNIGYFMIAEAIFVGIAETVRAMARRGWTGGRGEAGKRGMIIGIGLRT